jgi:hypothetical protein
MSTHPQTLLAPRSRAGRWCSYGAVGTVVMAVLTVMSACTPAKSDNKPNAVFVTTSAATTTTVLGQQEQQVDLKAVCPSTIVVQLDRGIDFWTLPWIAMIGINGNASATTYRDSLIDPVEREDLGISLELRSLPPDAKSSVDLMLRDSSILFAVSDLDQVVKSNNRTRVALVSAPWERDDAAIVWDPGQYPNINSIADFNTVSKLKIQTSNNEPSLPYLANSGLIPRSAFTETPQAVRMTRMLDEPQVVAADPARISWQFLDEAGWTNYPHAVAVSNANLESRDECLKAFVPKLQTALGVVVADPERFSANLVAVSALMSQSLDQPTIAKKITNAVDLGIIGNGSNKTIADVQRPRIAQMARALSIARKEVIRERDISATARDLAKTRTTPYLGLRLGKTT